MMAARTFGVPERAVVENGDRITWVYAASGAKRSLQIDPNYSLDAYLHTTAIGKSWLATLPFELALKYMLRQGKDLQATAKAFALMELLNGLGIPELTKPELTGDWEFQLRQVQRKQKSRGEFMTEIAEMTRHIVDRAKKFEYDTIPGDFGVLKERCPKCGCQDDKVIDSRASREGATIRRRRECVGCGHRYTTYEEIERAGLVFSQ